MSATGSTLRVWEYDRADEARLRAAARIALDGLDEPDLEVALVSDRANHLTVQVLRGALRDPASVFYVEGRGRFELVRVEPWPGSRTLLVLRATPALT